MKQISLNFLLGIFLILGFQSDLDAQATFTTNGSAQANLGAGIPPPPPDCINNGTYQITTNTNNQIGAVWANAPVNLGVDFVIESNVYLGALNNGADGIAFVLHSNGPGTIGAFGGSLGYAGINNSVAVELDAFDNFPNFGDPQVAGASSDHLDIVYDGNLGLQQPNFAPILFGTNPFDNNIEDNAWHTLRIDWNFINATQQCMTVTFDGVVMTTHCDDMINTVFNGVPFVTWGFTAATGGFNNNQAVCITNAPKGFSVTGDAIANLDPLIPAIPANFPDCMPNTSHQLTDVVNWEAAAVWSNNPIDFNQDFTLEANVYLGNTNGADGIAFVMQDHPNGLATIGRTGGNLGYGDVALVNDPTGAVDIAPSLAVELDVFNNGAAWGDLVADHLDIVYNGVTSTDGTNVNGANFNAVALANLEDGNWHTFRIEYRPCLNDQCLNIFVDGTLQATHCADFRTDIFAGNQFVRWGFTGATGTSNNFQAFCITTCQQNPADIPEVAVNDLVVCVDDIGTLTATVTGGEAPFDYAWTNAANVLIGAQQTLTTGTAGIYSVTATDNDGCSADASGTVSISDLGVTLSGDTTICEGTCTLLTAAITGGIPVYTYSWEQLQISTGGVWTSLGSTSASLSVCPTEDTRYRVSVLDANGCVVSSTLRVNVSTGLTASISADPGTKICFGESVDLTASATGGIVNYSFDWTGLGTNNLLTVSPNSNTTYSVVVTDDFGCTATASHDVEVGPCCPQKTDPTYLQIGLDTDPAVFAQNGIILLGTNAWLTAGVHHVLPTRIYIDEGITLIINGQNTVADFTNADVVLGECARIQVINGGDIRAYNAVFRPCDETTSWKGIEMTVTPYSTNYPTGNFRECTFINADIGINMGHIRSTINFDQRIISSLTIQDNLFSNCRIGLRMNNFFPNQAISGNNFQIDNVDQITFHELEGCVARNNLTEYYGILTSAKNASIPTPLEYGLNISQNTFVNATPIASASLYNGIKGAVTGTHTEISHNDFTNMWHSVDWATFNNDQFRLTTIDQNAIHVSRRSALRGKSEAQILVRNTRMVNINNNTITSSADRAPVQVGFPAPANHAFMQCGIELINVGQIGQGWAVVQENTITGFEVGICARDGVYDIHNNKIKGDYYGIYFDHDGFTAGNNLLGTIKCNEIEMDWETNSTSVGIAVQYDQQLDDNLYINGNCIKNTTRAIEVIAPACNSNTRPCSIRGTNYTRLPNIIGNFLYNYSEAGILVDGDFESSQSVLNSLPPQIGGLSGSNTSLFEDGNNTFISNNEDNGAFDIYYAPSANSAYQELDAINNDFGQLALNGMTFNVRITQWMERYPSFAACGNQEAVFSNRDLQAENGAFAINPTPGVKGWLYLCGHDNVHTNPNILFRTNGLGENVLEQDFLIELEKITLEDQDGTVVLGIAEFLMETLSHATDKDVLYQTVLNTGHLKNNQVLWLDYAYHKASGDLQLASQSLQTIAPNSNEETARKTVESILINLDLTDRNIREINPTEVAALQAIESQETLVTSIARDLLNEAVGGYNHVLNPYRLPSTMTMDNRKVTELDLDALNIFPNPSTDQINIEFVVTGSNENIIQIYSAVGKLYKTINTQSVANTIRVDISDLPQGMYIATLQSGDEKVQSGKFIKE